MRQSRLPAFSEVNDGIPRSDEAIEPPRYQLLISNTYKHFCVSIHNSLGLKVLLFDNLNLFPVDNYLCQPMFPYTVGDLMEMRREAGGNRTHHVPVLTSWRNGLDIIS